VTLPLLSPGQGKQKSEGMRNPTREKKVWAAKAQEQADNAAVDAKGEEE